MKPMEQKTATDPKQAPFALVVLTAAVALLALAAGKGVRAFQSWQVMSQTELTPPADSNESLLEKSLARDKEVAEALKTQNLIAPPPPESNPVREVAGIMGNEAFINGQWRKVGDKIGEAEILAIEPTFVKVTWKGQESMLAPIGSAGGGGGGASGPRGPSRAMTSRGGPSRVSRPAGGRMMRMPPGMPEGMTPDKIRSMSPEERRALFEKMRNR
jgi:hypothetical protein